MKKITVILLVISMLMLLASCGNRGMGMGNYEFTHAHISDGANGYCVEVISWYEHEGEVGVELDTKEYGAMFCSEGTYILIESNKHCPFC